MGYYNLRKAHNRTRMLISIVIVFELAVGIVGVVTNALPSILIGFGFAVGLTILLIRFEVRRRRSMIDSFYAYVEHMDLVPLTNDPLVYEEWLQFAEARRRKPRYFRSVDPTEGAQP